MIPQFCVQAHRKKAAISAKDIRFRKVSADKNHSAKMEDCEEIGSSTRFFWRIRRFSLTSAVTSIIMLHGNLVSEVGKKGLHLPRILLVLNQFPMTVVMDGHVCKIVTTKWALKLA